MSGATGSGKTTLVDILLGLLRPTSGHVLLDGSNLAGRERAWQRLVGYVPQDPYLLDDTVRRNIAFGVTDSLIDEQRLAKARVRWPSSTRSFASCRKDSTRRSGRTARGFPGGQRQRVAIARALYGDPPCWCSTKRPRRSTIRPSVK